MSNVNASLRLLDRVRLRYTPEKVGHVAGFEEDHVLVQFGQAVHDLSWIPLEFLELSPGNEEVMVA